jgi:hypothetical protein
LSWLSGSSGGTYPASLRPVSIKGKKKKKGSYFEKKEAMIHGCNPSYSGGRDLEDHGSKPAPGK